MQQGPVPRRPPTDRASVAQRLRGLTHRRRVGLDRAPARVPKILGAVGLLAIVLGCLTVVAVAARGPGSLSPPSHSHFFPAWLAGPLGGLWPFPSTGTTLLAIFDYAVGGMYVAYVLAVVCAPRLRARWTLAAIIVVHVIFLLSPPLALTDVFNYLNYGRMEIVHGLNPYVTIPALEPHGDPAYALSNWHHLLSPYGPLFTLFSFALVPLGVATSFWIFKACLMLASLGTLCLVWRCARLLHRDPLRAVLLVGLNPPVLVWGLGADHNDFLMVLFMMLAVNLLLSSRRPSFSSALSIEGEWIGRSGRLARRARVAAAAAAGAVRARRPLTAAASRWHRARALGAATAATRLPLLARRLTPGRAWAPAAPRAGSSRGPGRLVVAASAPAVTAPAAVPRAGGGGLGERSLGEAPWPPRRAVVAATRERAFQFCAGLALVAACAIKLPAAILIPILVVVAPRRLHLLAGMGVALAAVAWASYTAFGPHLPDLGVQSNLVTTVGLPNLLGAAIGLGGETVGLRLVLTVVLLVVVGLCVLWARRRHGDWIVPAGLAVLVLVLTLSWQAPWYVLWLLPLAALARRPHLRVASLLLGVYLILAYTSTVNIRPPSSALQQVHAGETKHLVH
ncbi:MAG: alpha,6-mannosyltransferase [Solirubrobacteraceae bacterium]|nr:alpha,6-mannosyltransferase [Solirubrobacteraceae bacterium]